MNHTAEFDTFMDDFFVHLFSRRPVDATFAGLAEYNSRLPALDAGSLTETIAEIEALLRRLDAIDPGPLDRFQRIDYDLARGFLKTQLWERRSGHFFGYNPTTYTGEAAFALVSLFVSDFRPIGERAIDLTARLEAIPAFLASARENLAVAPPAWTERAIGECTGALNFLRNGIPILREDEGLAVDDAPVAAAIDAFERFQEFLRTELLTRPGGAVSVGEAAFRNIMRWSHQSEADPGAFADHAEEVIRECDRQLAEGARELGFSSVDAALASLQDTHPAEDEYLSTYRSLWEASREMAVSHDLLTWRDAPVRYQPLPRWWLDVQPHLYFLFYRCPPRWNQPAVYPYHVIPVDPDLPAEERLARLKANNTFVIKTNHVLHHGGLGHHMQNWNAVRARSRIAQVAATDGPARLLMLCAGTLVEGWACYATELGAGAGFLTPIEAYAEIASRRRMAARAVVDVRLHFGQFSLEEAEAFYRDRAGMGAAAARAEAVKNSLFPGGAIMYLYGIEAIERLRTACGDRSDREFHDELLSYGSIPVDRIAREMTATSTVTTHPERKAGTP